MTESEKAIQDYLARGGKVTRTAAGSREPEKKGSGVLRQLRKGERND